MNKDNQQFTKKGIIMFFLATLFFYYDYTLQVAPSVMFSSLLKDFNIDATSIGLLLSAFFYSYTIMQLPTGLLYDQFGAKKILIIASLLCTLGSLLFAVAPNFFSLELARFFTGVGAAFAFVGVLNVSINWCPIKYFPILAGITQTLGSIGAINGQIAVAYLNNIMNWRHVFALLFIIGAFISLMIILFLQDSQLAKEKMKDKISLSLVLINMYKSLKAIFLQKQTWWIALYSICIWSPITLFAASWGIPFMIKKYHISNNISADLCSLVWIGVAIGSPAIGWISLKLKKRCLPLTISAFIGCIATYILIYSHIVTSLYILSIVLLFLGLAAGGQTLIFAVVEDINNKSNSSTAMGFNNMAVVSGGAIFQPIIGFLIDKHHVSIAHLGALSLYSLNDYKFSMFVIPICFVVAMITSMLFIKETYCKSSY